MSIYAPEWTPRWYYILKNTTSNKQYIGQTKRNIETYLGSGTYWKNHCASHGGHNRANIETVWCYFYEEQPLAALFLKEFEEMNPNYWRSDDLETWANLTRENTLDCTFDTYERTAEHTQAWKDSTYNNPEWRATVMVESHRKAKAKLNDRAYLEESGAIENWKTGRLAVVADKEKEKIRIDKFKESYHNTVNDPIWKETIGKQWKENASKLGKESRARTKASRLRECPICKKNIDCANLARHLTKHNTDVIVC